MNGVSRFLSRREKKGKGHTPSAKDIYRIFHHEDKKKSSRDEEKNIQEISKRLEELEITDIKDSHIKYALQHPYSNGDPDKAVQLIRLFHETISGKMVKFNPVIPMLGAENRNMVTCYIDSLLFAMFARVDSFESMLSVEFHDPAINQLAITLRFWVNMLRTGKLITVDIAKHIQDAMADCGWEDAREIRQQDLALPLLTLKMDVYHTGKESMDDHRYVRERLLDVAIPEGQAEGTAVKLEDCLESFFNNKIEVKRLLQRRNTVNSRPQLPTEKGGSSNVEEVELKRQSTTQSVFRQRKMELLTGAANKITTPKDDTDVIYGGKQQEAGQAVRKEVTIPAWQFFNLIPWFQAKPTTEGQPTTDAQVAAHFAKRRPVLGICLKRYGITKDGPRRVDTYIDIPLEIRLPHFVSNGNEEDGFGSSFSTFKLSLQSVIFHRGVSLNAGHYVSIVRPAPNEIRFEGSESDRKCQWLMFDDLAKERVTTVDIRKALKKECPYLLFYQVQPVDDDEEEETYSERSFSDPEEPPTYAEATNISTPATTEARNSTATITPETSVSQSLSQLSLLPAERDDIITPEARVAHLPPAQILLTPRTASPSSSARSLEQALSAPPKLGDDTLRPRSLDIPRTSKSRSRKSQDSDQKRNSVAFTDSSYGHSATTTPHEDATTTTNKDGYIGAKELTSPQESVSGTTSPPRKRGSTEKSEKRSSRALWLSVGSRRARPKSMPPADSRMTMGDLVKGIRGAMSKDKLPLNVTVTTASDSTTSEQSNPATRAVEAEGPPLPDGTTTNGKEKTKEKDKYSSIGRRKSLRPKSKSRGEATPPEDPNAPDRQCAVM
ncbi:cysteine proteinase [Microthyrium microscopicum]|uniref:ubiquitinyl hydrolase 1 n=1 Tax=Microthyrium microscopicum TaxID=703497 RepID=A0A6A6U1Q4_9PEZI|nr:cysteine proteinase [Microthyrium microscopicum]